MTAVPSTFMVTVGSVPQLANSATISGRLSVPNEAPGSGDTEVMLGMSMISTVFSAVYVMPYSFVTVPLSVREVLPAKSASGTVKV